MRLLGRISLRRASVRALIAGAVVLFILGAWPWLGDGAGEDGGESSYNSEWFGQGWNPAQETPKQYLRFNHEFHVVEQELACTDCHMGAREEAHAGMPTMEDCGACHFVEPEGDDRADCLLCHAFAEPPPGCSEDGCPEDALPDIVVERLGPAPYPNLRYPQGDEGTGFSHALHVDMDVRCEDCHADVASQTEAPFPTGRWMPKPERCFACHAKDLRHFSHKAHTDRDIDCVDCHEGITEQDERPFPEGRYIPEGIPTATPEPCKGCHEPVPRTCELCHVPGTFAKTVPPATHVARWTEFHGTAAQLNEENVHGKDCQTCHAKTDCVACHNTRPPRDHTNFWRVRGHGLAVAGDRERCENCHRQDFCERCHNETAPRTHVGNWQSRHCTWCHLSGGLASTGDNCRVCHRVILHASAPHPVAAGTANCFDCHDPVTGSAK